MADPPVATPEQQALLDKITASQKMYNEELFSFNNLTSQSSTLLSAFQNGLGAVGDKLNNLGKMASEQTNLFTAFGLGVVNAQKAFAGFNNIDAKGITTFSAQIDELGDMLMKGGTAGALARDNLETLKQKFLSMGGSPALLAKAVEQGSSAVLGLMKNMVANADRALVAEGSMLRYAAASGQLSTMMEKAGPTMANLNILMDTQNNMMNLAQKSTNSTREQIQNYYNSLLQIPKAINETVNADGKGIEKMSMLTAAIKLAHGTHRDYGEVIQDVHKSFTDYGVTGEAALRFTSRFSEISNKYGLELKDVREGLTGATSAFKDMTNAGEASAKMQENAAKFMNDYVQRLKDAGMTGKHAIETVQGVTSAMGSLNIAQKAFLSSQTGGPGGLMGGFQIEKMIQQGDTEGLQKKMMQVMQRQFGKIVTLDEASKSQAAAAQLEKQTMLLRQGPMGQLVKSDQDAYRFLDAMKAQQEGRAYKDTSVKGGALDPLGLQNAIKSGSTWEEKSHTVVSDIATSVSAIQKSLETMSLGGIQTAFTAADVPNQGPMTEKQLAMRKDLKDSAAEAQLRGGQATKDFKYDMSQSGAIKSDRTAENIKNNVDDMVKAAGRVPDAVRSGMDSLRRSTSRTETPATPPINTMIDQRRQAQTRAPAPSPTPPAQQVRDATGKVLPAFLQNMGSAPSPGARVAAATRAPAPPRETAGPLTQNLGAPKAPQPNVTVEKQGETGRINVKVIVTEEPASTNADAIAKAGSISP